MNEQQETQEKKVDFKIFAWAMGIVFLVVGYLFTQMASLQSKMDPINAQLAQIQTDLQWIKSRLSQQASVGTNQQPSQWTSSN